MTAKPGVAQGQELKPGVTDLWAARNIYDCDFWFLGVEHATEMTESFRELDASKEGESFTAQVKVQRGARLGLLAECAQNDQNKGLIDFFFNWFTVHPGDPGIRFGSPNCPPAAGRVLLQWTGQKLVVSTAPEG